METNIYYLSLLSCLFLPTVHAPESGVYTKRGRSGHSRKDGGRPGLNREESQRVLSSTEEEYQGPGCLHRERRTTPEDLLRLRGPGRRATIPSSLSFFSQYPLNTPYSPPLNPTSLHPLRICFFRVLCSRGEGGRERQRPKPDRRGSTKRNTPWYDGWRQAVGPERGGTASPLARSAHVKNWTPPLYDGLRSDRPRNKKRRHKKRKANPAQ